MHHLPWLSPLLAVSTDSPPSPSSTGSSSLPSSPSPSPSRTHMYPPSPLGPLTESRRQATAASKRKFSQGFSMAALATVGLLAVVAPGAAQAASSGIGGVERLFTSSVSYCAQPQAILVSNLDLAYYNNNQTLEFDISAASVRPDLNVTVSLQVNAYGISAVNLNLDLCSVVNGVLCPLPQYNFNGGGIFPVPDEFASKIPSIAYNLPDLQAAARVELTDPQGEVVACLAATLSNGHSTRQSGAVWGTVGLALLASVSSLMHSAIAQSVGAAQWRIVDVMVTIQHAAVAGLLSLNYPVVYTSYALNFAWSLGLIYMGPVQNSISNTRNATGGNANDNLSNAVLQAITSRKSSPFTSSASTTTGLGGLGLYKSMLSLGAAEAPNAIDASAEPMMLSASSSYASPMGVSTLAELVRRKLRAPNTGANGQLDQGSTGGSIPYVGANDTIALGIPTYSERANIPAPSAFLTVLVTMFMLVAVVIGALAVIYAFALLIWATTRKHTESAGAAGTMARWSHRFTRPSEFLGSYTTATFGRILLITMPIYMIFAFYQWNHGDSWVPDFLAAVFLVMFLAALALLFLPMFRFARRGSKEDLYYNDETAPASANPIVKRWGPMAHPFRPTFFWFALVLLLAAFLRACFLGFGQDHGFRQSIGLIVVEALLFLALCICRPGRDKTSDFVSIVLSIFRIISWGLTLVFAEQLSVAVIPRVVVGFALIVFTGLPIIFLFFVTVWDLGWGIIWLRRKLRPAVVNAGSKPLEMEHADKYEYGQVAGNIPRGSSAGTLAPASSSERSNLLTKEKETEAAAVGAATGATATAGAGFPRSGTAGSGSSQDHTDLSGQTAAAAATPAALVQKQLPTPGSGTSQYQDASSELPTPATYRSGATTYQDAHTGTTPGNPPPNPTRQSYFGQAM